MDNKVPTFSNFLNEPIINESEKWITKNIDKDWKKMYEILDDFKAYVNWYMMDTNEGRPLSAKSALNNVLETIPELEKLFKKFKPRIKEELEKLKE